MPATKRRVAKLWQLRLYVMDQTPKSLTAFANLKRVCETHLKGRYRITVIDLIKQPQLAKGDQILAIPTVVRKLPKPVRTIIGNLSDTARVLVGLDLRAAEEPAGKMPDPGRVFPSPRQPSKRRICGMIMHLARQHATYPGPEVPPDPDSGAADEVGRHA